MKIFAAVISIFVLSFLVSSCSSTKETTKEETKGEDSVYVFDQPPVETKKEEPVVTGTYYLVQVGAFSTKDKAETFSETFRSKINDEISVKFDNEKNLYLVQLVNKFTSKPDAEKKRDQIKQNKEFSDVWIVTVNK